MNKRLTAYFSGRVQGVGFRYATQRLAMGYDVCGTVRNLLDGRVELIIEGQEDELNAFIQGIEESDLKGFIQEKELKWEAARNDLRGFKILPT